MKLKPMLTVLLMALFMTVGSVWAADAVNINTATAKQLQEVEGIGSITAAKIVAYRDEHGAFNSIDDLLKIKGIGKKTVAKARDELSVGDSESH